MASFFTGVSAIFDGIVAMFALKYFLLFASYAGTHTFAKQGEWQSVVHKFFDVVNPYLKTAFGDLKSFAFTFDQVLLVSVLIAVVSGAHTIASAIKTSNTPKATRSVKGSKDD